MTDPSQTDNPGPALMSRQDAARYLGVSLMSVIRLIDARRLAVVRIGRRVMISRAELDRFIAAGGESSHAGDGASVNPPA